MFKIIRFIKKVFTLFIVLTLIVTMGLVFVSIKYPIGYKNFIVQYSNENDLDPYLVAALINVESKYDKNAISQKEARGLMQIGPQTGKWASEVLNIENYSDELLYDPETNIKIGTWYIKTLYKEFNGNLDLVLAAYNAGSGNVNKWLKDEVYSKDGESLNIIPYKETDDYVIRVKENYKVYSTLYKKYILNPSEKDTFYVNLIHNIKKIVIQLKNTI